MNHPSCSPDFNPIEMIWGIMKEQLKNYNQRFNRLDLIEKIQELWDSISDETLIKIIDHTNKVYKLVIEAKGDNILKG